MAKEISRQCEECVQHIRKGCKGKPDIKETSYFGTPKSGRKSGLNFCSKYEFDESCYPKESDAFIIENNKTIIKRAKVRKVEQEKVEHSDLVDFAAGLSSDDFKDLLV